MRHRYEGAELRRITPRRVRGTGGKGLEQGSVIKEKPIEDEKQVHGTAYGMFYIHSNHFTFQHNNSLQVAVRLSALKAKLQEKRVQAKASVKLAAEAWDSRGGEGATAEKTAATF